MAEWISTPTWKKRKRQLGNCIYCNEPATTTDHIIPVSSVSNYLKRSTERRQSQNRDFQVPACRQCNVVLNDSMHATMQDRMTYLLGRLEKRKDVDPRRLRFLARVIELQKAPP